MSDRNTGEAAKAVVRRNTEEVQGGGYWALFDERVDGDVVTTYKTYHGTHMGVFLGVAPIGRQIQFETVDAMRVRNGKITEHWGVANLFSVLQQLGAWPPGTQA